MRIILLTTALCLGALVSVSSGAADLASAALMGVGGNSCRCTIVSLSNKTHELTIEHVDTNGNIVDVTERTIEPGRPATLTGTCGSNSPNYCRVSGKFPRKKFRGAYCVTASTTEGICVPLE